MLVTAEQQRYLERKLQCRSTAANKRATLLQKFDDGLSALAHGLIQRIQGPPVPHLKVCVALFNQHLHLHMAEKCQA